MTNARTSHSDKVIVDLPSKRREQMWVRVYEKGRRSEEDGGDNKNVFSTLSPELQNASLTRGTKHTHLTSACAYTHTQTSGMTDREMQDLGNHGSSYYRALTHEFVCTWIYVNLQLYKVKTRNITDV